MVGRALAGLCPLGPARRVPVGDLADGTFRRGGSGCEQFSEFRVLAFEAGADLFAEAVDGAVDDAVVDGSPLFSATDDAGVEEHSEVLGDVLLSGARRCDELPDAGFAFHQLLDESDAEGVAEGTEALRDQLDDRLGKRMRLHAPNRNHYLSVVE